MKKNKTVVFLGDGMADEPVAELGGKTPLQHARTPAMDSIAKAGRCGTLLTLPEGFPTSSEVANMSVLGCDLKNEYCGRGPLEASGQNIDLKPGDKAFRINLTSTEDGILKDFSGGHLSQEAADELIEALNQSFGSDTVRFYSGVSYRNIMILSGSGFSHKVRTEKPDDNQEEPIEEHLPTALNAEAEETATFLNMLIREAPAVLEASPVNQQLKREGRPMVNGVWPGSGGEAGDLKSLSDKYGITSAVISAVDVIIGLGRCLGMDVINVPGATGYIDTNYEGKADAAVKALEDHDFVYVHLEAIDEVSHARDLQKKIQAIEDFDSRIIARVLKADIKNLNTAILPDHPVPVSIGKHTRVPVPVAVHMQDVEPDSIDSYDELICRNGILGEMTNGDLMKLLFPG